jgi:hypothetical protein
VPSESTSGSHARPDDLGEYTAGLSRRHAAEPSTGISHRTLRLIFFALAGLWGFIAGVAGLLAALGFAGTSVHPSAEAVAALIPGAVVAVIGGAILAGAYQEARRRK